MRIIWSYFLPQPIKYLYHMKKQKRSKAISLVTRFNQQSEILDPQCDFFPFQRSKSKASVLNNINPKQVYHKTECNSPVETNKKRPKFFLPEIASNEKILPFSLQAQRKAIGVRTVKFLDSLINILKEQDEYSIRESVKMKLKTEQQSYFQKRQRSKPKILQNKVTKQFFNKTEEVRRAVVSQSCSRKMRGKTQPIEEYTFYGGYKPKLTISNHMQFDEKNLLNQLRLSKLKRIE